MFAAGDCEDMQTSAPLSARPEDPLDSTLACTRPPQTAFGGAQGLLWVADMIRLSLSPVLGSRGRLPPTLYGDDLEHLDKGSWLAFERLLVANDRWVPA